MATPDPGSPDWLTGLPPLLQAIITIVVAAVLAVGAKLGWKTGKADVEKSGTPSTHAVVVGGAFADRKALERLCDILERGVQMWEHHLDDEAARERITLDIRMKAALQELEDAKRESEKRG
jgi:hypothetical protein